MKDKFKFIVVMLFALASFGCNVRQPAASEIDVFVAEISRTLRNVSSNEQIIKLKIPSGVAGILVISAPYAISSGSGLDGVSSELVNKELVSKVQDDSAYHLFIVKGNKILIHERWSSPPVVFNGVFSSSLINNKQLEFKVRNKVLLGITTSDLGL